MNNLKTPSGSELISLKDDTIIITKWNWEYEIFLEYQAYYQEVVRQNKNIKILLICNHPHCFTMGRGIERNNTELIEVSEAQLGALPFECHKIHRGGGLTFHHPGQLIFYPIVKLNPQYSLDDHMCWQLKLLSSILREDLNLEYTVATKKTMGIWYQKNKLASIGVGVKKFVSEHGTALNISFDSKMKDALKSINPCGLDPTVYSCVNDFLQSPISVGDFHQLVVNKLNN